MNKDKINILNEIISNYNQYKPSHLQDDIDAVLKCGITEATQLGKSHCNLISFWAMNYADGKTDLSYRNFFQKSYEKKLVEENGNMLITKDKLCPIVFGFDFKLKYSHNFEDVLNPILLNPDKFYQMRILDRSHFMSCYIDKGVLMISDTSSRGIGVSAKTAKRIDKVHFAWLMEI